jgi:hypothetical protein
MDGGRFMEFIVMALIAIWIGFGVTISVLVYMYIRK